MRLIGFDPGLRVTGWGVVEAQGSRISHVANGAIRADVNKSLAHRLLDIHDGIHTVLDEWQPDIAGVEEVFVNVNPMSTLKLGQARGVALLVPALHGLRVEEFSATQVKKSVVGVGHAAKEQVDAMVKMLLPGVKIKSADAADALAVAICLAHHVSTEKNLSKGRVQ